jgi:hypothetical protein
MDAVRTSEPENRRTGTMNSQEKATKTIDKLEVGKSKDVDGSTVWLTQHGTYGINRGKGFQTGLDKNQVTQELVQHLNRNKRPE